MTTNSLAKQKAQFVRSEIGAFPSDWPVRRLDQIAGGVSVGLVINPSTYISDQGTVPMLLGSQVTANKIDHETARRITPQSNAKIPASILRAGDLVTVRVGDPGTTAVVANELDGCNCASMMIVRRGTSFNSAWLSHLMNSPLGRRQVANVQYGTAQKQFNIGDAVGFLFPVPSKAEQDAIAQALSDADALIDSLEQLLTKKRLIKQGAMQELLTGKRRLPGLARPWATRKLGEIATITMGRTPARLVESFWGIGHKWLSIADLKGKVIAESKEEITDAGAEGMEQVPEGTLVMSFKLTIGRLSFAGCRLYTNEAICALRSPQVDKELLYYALSRVDFSLFGKQAVKGYTLNKASLHNVEVTLPSDPEEQRAIAQVLADLDTEIAAIEARLTKARALKQAMAQALLTGRIRLVEPTP